MTYCLGWKYNGKAFIVADTAITSFEPVLTQVDKSTFGEKHEEYNHGYVEESKLKLLKLNEDTLVSFSGTVAVAEEAIYHLRNMLEYNFSIDESLKSLQQNYSNYNFELLIITRDKQENKLFYFSTENYFEVEDYKEIGSGKDVHEFSDSVISFLLEKENDGLDSDTLLACVVIFIQCISIKHMLFRFGVGGTIFGAFLDKQINWCKDLFYYLYQDELLSNQSCVSVISRFDTVCSASGYDGINRMFTSDDNLLNDESKHSIITKTLIDPPDYFVLFSPYYNVIYLMYTQKRVYNTVLKMYTKREDEATKFAFVFDHQFTELAQESKYKTKISPFFSYVITFDDNYIPREELIATMESNGVIIDRDLRYDLDLREFEFKNRFDFTIDILEFLQHYKKIIILDADFLFDKLIEKYIYFKKLGVNLHDLRLDKLISNLYENCSFNEFGIIVYCNQNRNYIYNNDFEFLSWLSSYKRIHFIYQDINCNQGNNIDGFIFEYFKNLYHNEIMYHINRTYICTNNPAINQILELTPRINIEIDIPDFVIIRNHNSESEILGYYKYLNVDLQIGAMFGLTIEKMSMWDSYHDTEYEEAIIDMILN